jgi:hypothetical protein
MGTKVRGWLLQIPRPRKTVKHWELLRRGSTEQALALLRESYEREPSGSHIMGLGVAYLWSGEYRASWEHFQHAIKTHPQASALFYGMAGVAKWCVNDPEAAVKHWQLGLGARYADGAGGVHLPLLLLVASILRPGVLARKEAEQILMQRVQDPRTKNWPGPLATFALGLIDHRTLREKCLGSTELGTIDRNWSAAFYEDVLEFGRGKAMPYTFKERMRRIADSSQPERSEERFFLSLLWSEEFFIARHESSLI